MRKPVAVPELQETLRARTEALAAEQPRIVQLVLSAVVASDASYRSLSETMTQDLRSNVVLLVAMWFKTLLAARGPNDEDLHALADCGRRRFHQGVSLTSLFGAFRVGSKVLWRATLELGGTDEEVRDGLLFTVSPYLLEHFDFMAQTMSAAYLDEQYERTRGREALRHELVCLVFSFPEDTAAFRRACEALRIDPTIPRVALALEVTVPDVLPSRAEGELDQMVVAIARQLKMASEELVRTMHRGRLVIWVPTTRGESILATDRLLQGYANALVRAVPGVSAVGVGLMNDGPAGWAESVGEAFKALEAGLRRGRDANVFLYSDVAVSDSVLRACNVLRYLNSLLERISLEPELLTTLATYFDQGQHRKLTSAALGIHPNTLNYRLERIESILGARLDEAGWISRLDVAVRLRRLSQIPEV